MSIGKNDDFSWGITNMGGDIQDLFVLNETLDKKGYMKNDGPKNYRFRDEKIFIKNSQPKIITIKTSEYGPVINDIFNISGIY
jgi:penicillin G amidase